MRGYVLKSLIGGSRLSPPARASRQSQPRRRRNSRLGEGFERVRTQVENLLRQKLPSGPLQADANTLMSDIKSVVKDRNESSTICGTTCSWRTASSRWCKSGSEFVDGRPDIARTRLPSDSFYKISRRCGQLAGRLIAMEERLDQAGVLFP